MLLGHVCAAIDAEKKHFDIWPLPQAEETTPRKFDTSATGWGNNGHKRAPSNQTKVAYLTFLAFSPFFSCQVAETSRSSWPYGSDQVVFCFEPNLGIVECSNLRFENVLIWNVVRCIHYHNKKSHFPLTCYGKNIFKSNWIMSCMFTILHHITALSKELTIQWTPCIRS